MMLNKISSVADVAESRREARKHRSDWSEIPISSPFSIKLQEKRPANIYKNEQKKQKQKNLWQKFTQ
jgi:hypothetical protein